jgi:lipocalin
VNLPFLVLSTDPDYLYVPFGEQNRQLGQVFSRTAAVPDAHDQSLLGQFRSLGCDMSQFVRVVQEPGQIGQPGSWRDGTD